MLNNLNILFSSMILLGPIISISSTNWLGVWMGMELNLISFVPFMINSKNIASNESAIIYFLVQASASSMFLMFCTFNSMQYFLFSSMISSTLSMIMLSMPLFIKLGAAPFQPWFVNIISKLNWTQCFVLMSWQKFTPLFLLFYLEPTSTFYMLMTSASLIVGSIGGLSQTLPKKILAFSSVNHVGWLMTSVMLSKKLLYCYILFYTLMTLFVVIQLSYYNINTFNQTFSMDSFSLAISLLSLGGLPPFLGFLPKWMIIQTMIMNSHLFLTIILMMTTLITLYYYIRLMLKPILMSSSLQKWSSLNSNNSILNSMFVLMSCSGLIVFNIILT
uniref:NADH-ubiquinone oxidoreductase chain 2 n=1 Tax=Nepiomorpha sp. NespEL TaxID=1940904 RepID=A0A8K1ZG27_9NEOP|nr:NADH dehydrogenase subunit 2 [Nepiomorpha sp. NespEL]